MSEGRLYYTPGSPFARMARVLVREWQLPISEVQMTFPLPETHFEVNPLGQVPVLDFGEEQVFPTLLVMERLWILAGTPASAYAPEVERQPLLAVLQAGDALVAALYQQWAGLAPAGPNTVGYDPADRNFARVASVLAWLDAGAGGRGLREGVTLPSVAAACLVRWGDARGARAWKLDVLDRSVGDLARRESFLETRPPEWRPSV
jgi:glutathione S-transferase